MATTPEQHKAACLRKRAYATRLIAEHHARRAVELYRMAHLRAYRCPVCELYHLTSRNHEHRGRYG